MSPTCTLTAEQEILLTSVEQHIFSPKTSIGRLLFDLGREGLAYRFENCGKNRFRRCPNGHTDRNMRMYCESRFLCPYECAPRLAREHVENWKPAIKHLMATYSTYQLAYLEIFSLCDRSKESIHETLKSYTNSLFHAFLGRVPQHFQVPARFVAGYLKSRLLILYDPHLAPDFSRIFPGAKVSIRVEPVHLLLHLFESELLAPVVIDDLAERVDQELTFKGVHRLRAIGVQKDEGNPVTTSTEGDISVEDSTTEKSKAKKHSYDRCQTCGERFVKQSRDWILDGSDPNRLEWEDIYLE